MENALYVGGFEMEQKTAMKISMVSIVGNILLSLFKALAGIVARMILHLQFPVYLPLLRRLFRLP